MTTPSWWQEAVFYQIYPRSFADSDGDGVGDLEGLRRRLDHLAWLGVDAVWICPFYPSPMADFGYDVADYCDVDPLFGTLEDFDRLVADAHARGIRVIVDWVPNHTSDQHPWFVESRSSRDSPKRDWYVWRRRPTTAPNNWRAAFGGDAWTWDEATRQWYLHLFLPEQPDVNWRNPGLVEAMHDVLRFWLDRGVDGFRIDVVQGLAKDVDLADDPPGSVLPRSATNDYPDVHPLLRGLRAVVDAYPQEPVLVGEVYLLSTEQVASYLGRGDELHLAFDFTSLYAPWTAAAWRATLERVAAELDPVGGWPTWTLSNHDNARHATRYGGRGPGPGRSRAAADPAGNPVPLCGRGAGAGGRRWCPPTGSSTPAGGTGAGRPCRGIPRRRTAGRTGRGTGRAVAAVAARPRRPQRGTANGRTRPRSSTCTAGCWRPGAPARRCGVGPWRWWTWRRPTSSPTSGPAATATGGWSSSTSGRCRRTSPSRGTGRSRWPRRATERAGGTRPACRPTAPSSSGP